MFEDNFDCDCLEIDIDNDFKDFACSDNTKQSISKRHLENVDVKQKRVKLDEASIQPKPVSKNHDLFNLPNRVLKRKFPGPAGLLPTDETFDSSLIESIREDESAVFPLLSQQTCEVYKDGPWKVMKEDLHVNNEEHIVDKFNIRWIKRNKSRYSANCKAPFLAAILQNLEIIDGKIPTINVTLKDPTGSIPGTILHSLYEEYSTYFRIGSVLVLKQFGVFTTGFNKFCLTITHKNILTIYYPEVPRQVRGIDADTSVGNDESGTVKKFVIQRYDLEEMVQCYDDIMTSSKSRSGMFRNDTNDSSFDQSSSKVVIRTCSDAYTGSRLDSVSVKRPTEVNNKRSDNASALIEKRNTLVQPGPSKAIEESSEIVKEILEDIDINSFLGDF